MSTTITTNIPTRL